MIRHTFSDGSYIEYRQGRFDKWCIYYDSLKEFRGYPRDVEYFAWFKFLYKETPQIYKDYLWIYQNTTKDFNPEICNMVSKRYINNYMIDLVLNILYFGMVAEENKKYTKLGKKVKRLGIFELIDNDKTPEDAANSSKGKTWKELDKLCKLNHL